LSEYAPSGVPIIRRSFRLNFGVPFPISDRLCDHPGRIGIPDRQPVRLCFDQRLQGIQSEWAAAGHRLHDDAGGLARQIFGQKSGQRPCQQIVSSTGRTAVDNEKRLPFELLLQTGGVGRVSIEHSEAAKDYQRYYRQLMEPRNGYSHNRLLFTVYESSVADCPPMMGGNELLPCSGCWKIKFKTLLRYE